MGISDMPVGGSFNSQQNPVYNTQNTPNYNNFQHPAGNNPPPPSTSTSVTTIASDIRGGSFEIIMIKPENYFTDGRKIADLLMSRKTVIVNFEETKKETVVKLLDFLTGVAYATNSQISRNTEKSFALTPPGTVFTAEVKKPADREVNNRDSSIY